MKQSSGRHQGGFTLLEVVIAMAILAVALVAIFDLNAGAISAHAYSKKVTVASLLARSKMTDIEQRLYDKGFSLDDEEESGDFSDEGWNSFRWRAKIIAPKTSGVPPEQVLGAIFNLPLGAGDPSQALGGIGGLGGLGALGGLGGARGGLGGTPPSSASASGPTPVGGVLGLLGPLAQTQFNQMVEQIAKTVREVHLTVTWLEGKQVESLDLVTHVVSVGPGGDRNGTSNLGTLPPTPGAK